MQVFSHQTFCIIGELESMLKNMSLTLSSTLKWKTWFKVEEDLLSRLDIDIIFDTVIATKRK